MRPGCATLSDSPGTPRPASSTRATTDRIITATISRPNISAASPQARFTACRGINKTARRYDGKTASRACRRGRSATSSRRPPKIVAVRFEDGGARQVDELVTGFQLPDGKRWARPAGVAVGPDGALYFTSDSDTEALFRLRPAR